ncbi:MAG: selenide, water dikinase SelD [Planctomycetota bacterium]|nr:selenide, water dikinase SelD [Planctomycetota bacterium]MDI6787410.1 selenide, water dikinase SelD [Planctomycetota bacterium]
MPENTGSLGSLQVRLTRTVHSAGCAAKLSPGNLSRALCGLPVKKDPNLLVGLDKPDDAGVYKLSDQIAIIQTVDFFPPIVDDPYLFGQIAATNALSDIYAMGGKPITAMNVVGFPSEKLPLDILRQILKGGLDKVHEADAVLVGGHTIDDVELKYGLSVTGIIHPKKIITNSTAQPGDKLILTKLIGTGVITTALKAGKVSQKSISAVIKSMSFLNREASLIIQKTGVNACTDVTGFSLIGHSYIMAVNSDVSIIIDHKAVPYFPKAQLLVREGFIPGGTYNNRKFYSPYITVREQVTTEALNLLFDPQTSGGLLISVSHKKAPLVLSRLKANGIKQARIIGEVVRKQPARIIVI